MFYQRKLDDFRVTMMLWAMTCGSCVTGVEIQLEFKFRNRSRIKTSVKIRFREQKWRRKWKHEQKQRHDFWYFIVSLQKTCWKKKLSLSNLTTQIFAVKKIICCLAKCLIQKKNDATFYVAAFISFIKSMNTPTEILLFGLRWIHGI